jgi:hypothetical protein
MPAAATTGQPEKRKSPKEPVKKTPTPAADLASKKRSHSADDQNIRSTRSKSKLT